MCQPGRLTLPNGLLNADIKLARSFALPAPAPSLALLSFPAPAARSHYLPVLTPSLSLSLTCPLPLSLPLFWRSVDQHLARRLFSFSPRFFFFAVADSSVNGFILTPESLMQVFSSFAKILCSSVMPLFLSPPPTGSIMPSTHRTRPSRSPCCTSCRHRSMAWPTRLSSAWIGTGGAY